MAMWALVPDKADDKDEPPRAGLGVFATTAISFFIVEMGDKTQVATAALAVQFHNIAVVAAGTSTGMMLANIPAVFLGHAFANKLPLTGLRIGAALVYLALGLWSLAGAAGFI
jgi:putative Ca2+/H+ antiporter (TMEM165/GDT1 family)